MQFMDTLCCIFLTITLTTAYVKTESRRAELRPLNFDGRINRREAAVIVDNFPVETVFQKPKIIYRRLSKHRYGPSKPKYGLLQPIIGVSKPSRKPGKKYRNTSPKYRPTTYKKRSPKPRFGSTKKQNLKALYGPPKNRPQYTYFSSESSSFGEPPRNFDSEYQPPKNSYGKPPKNYEDEYQPPKHTYGEPPKSSYGIPMKPFDSYGAPVNPQNSYGTHRNKPMDSYGAPIKTTDEPFPTSPSYLETSSRFENHDYGFDNEYKMWKDFQNDQKFEPSKTKPAIVNPDIFVTPSSTDEEESNLNSYSDIYMHRQNLKEKKQVPKFSKNKKPQYFQGSYKVLNKPWKTLKTRQQPEDDVIVGGQYAEPPARYVPKFQPSAPMYNDEEEFPQQNFPDPDGPTISPYVNYKNSNLAFSPQNLNDAFSIVDK